MMNLCAELPAPDWRKWIWAAIGAMVIAIAFACASCATYTAVTEAPVEFWDTARGILQAVFDDLMFILDLIL